MQMFMQNMLTNNHFSINTSHLEENTRTNDELATCVVQAYICTGIRLQKFTEYLIKNESRKI